LEQLSARLNSLLKNAFAGREIVQGLKPNSIKCETYAAPFDFAQGRLKVMPCYKATCAAFFSKL